MTLPLCQPEEMVRMRDQVGDPGLMGRSISTMKRFVAVHLEQAVDIPGYGEAGSYEHNQHQLNYRLCESAGTLLQVTGDQRYANLASELLTRYADVYLELGFQEARNTNPPGRIFHQILNENIWLLAMSIGHGCVKECLDIS